MRILVLCHRLPYPPNKGDKIRSFHEIRNLAKRHQIHLLTFNDPDESGTPEDQLQRYCTEVEVFPLRPMRARLRCLRGLVDARPLTTWYFGSSTLASRVQELAVPENCDVLMACGSGMAPYAELAPKIPKLLDMVDVDSMKWSQYSQSSSSLRSLIWGLEARRLAAYESALGDVFDKIVLTTEHEVAILEAISPEVQAEVVRNGVDISDSRLSGRSKSELPTLVFTGQMDYFANVDGMLHFTTQVFPRLRRRWADLRLLIVGRSPTGEVKKLETTLGVTVTGEVDEIGPYLSEAWIFVAPLRIAQGVQNKVLEAMAQGIPTVVSDRVMAGLADGGFEDGRDLVVARDDAQLEGFIDELLGDEGRRQQLADNAQSRLAEHYSWDTNMLILERHLQDIVRSRTIHLG